MKKLNKKTKKQKTILINTFIIKKNVSESIVY